MGGSSDSSSSVVCVVVWVGGADDAKLKPDVVDPEPNEPNPDLFSELVAPVSKENLVQIKLSVR